MASEHTKHFSDADFETEVLKSGTPVLVDFWAQWCQPCLRLGPTIDKLASEYDGKVKIGKVDTDANHATALKYNINAIPTLILFKNGEIARKFVGLPKEADLRTALDAV